jgi:hypothetical protein
LSLHSEWIIESDVTVQGKHGYDIDGVHTSKVTETILTPAK